LITREVRVEVPCRGAITSSGAAMDALFLYKGGAINQSLGLTLYG